MVFVAILTKWIVLPALFITIGSLSTDIVDGTCMPWGVFSSYTLHKATMSLSAAVAFFAPLTAMLFGYSRIVYALKYKVADVLRQTITIILHAGHRRTYQNDNHWDNVGLIDTI